MKAKLYSISVSHPARSAGLMLAHKGIEAEIVDIPPGMQRVALRVAGFRGGTVPALKLDERKVQGTLQISRALDEVQPDPPLFPSDPQQRAAVEEAERWGEEELQPPPRNIFRWAAAHDQGLREALAKGAKLPAPAVASRVFVPLSWYFSRVISGSTEESVRSELAAIPGQIDHVDELIAGGVIGTDQPNAADFQIATSLRVLLNFPQLRPLIEGRPAEELAMQIAPKFGGKLPIKLPAEWVPLPVTAVSS